MGSGLILFSQDLVCILRIFYLFLSILMQNKSLIIGKAFFLVLKFEVLFSFYRIEVLNIFDRFKNLVCTHIFHNIIHKIMYNTKMGIFIMKGKGIQRTIIKYFVSKNSNFIWLNYD